MILEPLPGGLQDHVNGSPKAAITLVEYGDYQCTACGQAYTAVKESQKRFGNSLCFIFRNFPVSQIHREAQHAAEAAEAAGAQDRYWEMHGLLFENQKELASGFLVEYAQSLGLDTSRFLRDVSQHVFASRVRAEFLSGVRSGVFSTPTFFINGVRYRESWEAEPLFAALKRVAQLPSV